jgi:hypothetical protein
LLGTEITRQAPFRIGEQSFSVVIRERTLPVNRGDQLGRTISSISFEDGQGRVHPGQSFKVQTHVSPDGSVHFRDVVKAGRPEVLEDAQGKAVGLLFRYRLLPSAPATGFLFQFFLIHEGTLEPASAPVHFRGGGPVLQPGTSRGSLRLLAHPSGSPQRAAFTTRLAAFCADADVPVELDLGAVRMQPPATAEIVEATGRVILGGGAGGLGRPQALTLHPRLQSPSTPVRVALSDGSRIDFLQAFAEAQLRADSHFAHLDAMVSALEVRVHGKQGWVTDKRELDALALHCPFH